jgi:hypothetical protein
MSNDRELIIDVTTRVTWYADQRRWDEIPNLFAARVLLDYTRLTGGEPTTVEPSQIVQSWRASLGGLDATQHMVTNHLVDLSEDEKPALSQPLCSSLLTFSQMARAGRPGPCEDDAMAGEIRAYRDGDAARVVALSLRAWDRYSSRSKRS